jgi:signal transduction histidine kinase/CheY-like chemotaxis protein
MIVPMLSGADLLGMIVLEDRKPYRYSYEELQLMLTLAGSLSAIVQSTQLLDRLQRANDELRELDRLKSDFLANMSHELRTPLNSIIGFSRVMLKGIDGPLSEMQEQDLTTIYNSGNHLLALINDILDQAKIAAGKMDIKPSYVEPKAIIDVVKSMAIGYMKDKPLQLYVEVAPNLPKLYADEIRLRQVLINLVSNAIKFTAEGSVTLRVYPYLHPENQRTYVRMDVIDTGIGIAEQDLPLLFEAFRQVDSSLTRTQGGTGLGLPIARSLIEMMGGAMYVESAVNAGSTFSVVVPIEPPESEESAPGEDGQSSEAATPIESLRVQSSTRVTQDTRAVHRSEVGRPPMPVKRQILLIEDSPDMVDQFRRILQRAGFEVLAASITLEAEAMASGLRPTLVVMDVNFAGGVGWDILQRLKDRDDTFDIPIVVVTLNAEIERAYELGAHAVIQRPFVPDDLLKTVLQAERESNTERILIIDDQPESRDLLRKLLDAHGKYRVYTAANGIEGISMVARRRPDLVILDLRMPEMDGFAVLDELRSNPETSGIPVMVVTGDLDLTEDERDQLDTVRVLQKSDISQEVFNAFISGVQTQLASRRG